MSSSEPKQQPTSSCASGCCGQPSSATAAVTERSEPEPQPPPPVPDAYADSCCGGDEDEESSKEPVDEPTSCNSGCCGTSSKPEPPVDGGQQEELADRLGGGSNDNSDRKRTSPDLDRGCNNSCCGGGGGGGGGGGDGTEDDCSSTGCLKCDELESRGEKPCCDNSCLIRIAVRECQDVEDSTDDQRPCNQHMESARKRFGHILEAVGCICRALRNLNLESCCASQGKREEKSKSCCQPAPSNSALGLAKNSCCSSKTCNDDKPVTKTQGDSCCSTEACCDSKAKDEAIQTSCCASGGDCCEVEAKAQNEPTKDSCCSRGSCSGTVSGTDRTGQPGGKYTTKTDPEKGPATIEHVVLAIQGMTCTGCETKLFRTLSSMPGLTNIQASLVLSRAEFDLDASTTSTDDAIAYLKRTTGFECEQVITSGHTIEVTAIPFFDPLPRGITDARRVDAHTVRLTYDASTIGARTVINEAFGEPLRLAPPRPDPSIAAGQRHLRSVGRMTVLSAILTIPVLVLAWAPMLPPRPVLYGSISLALATVIQLVVAGPFYPAALKSLVFARVIEMDLLIVLSTSAAYIFSVVAFALMVQGRPLSTGDFFETSTLLVTLIMLGRYASALARQKAVEAITIRSLQTGSATLVVQVAGGRPGDTGGGGGGGSQTETIDARLLQYGDVFRLLADSRVATDGVVVAGASEVDESMVTGESAPVAKTVGSAVVAGSVNGWATLDVRVTRLPAENTISAIANMVDEAKLSKPRVQDVADRVAGYFVPAVGLLTLVTFVSWIAVGVVSHHLSAAEAAVQAATYAIAVLIISCPCAIGLAVPMVIVVAGGVAADHGVVFKTAETIEVAKDVTHVVFDKTGTLTRGNLTVVEENFPTGGGQDIVAGLVLGLVSGSKHPVSLGVARHLEARGIQPSKITDIKTVPGQGVEGVTPTGAIIRAGNSRWLETSSNPDASVEKKAASSSGSTSLCVAIDGELRAIFALQDAIRPEAQHVLSVLRKRGVDISLLSGDDDGPVQAVASQLGIPPTQARSRCSPGDKQQYIQGLVRGTPARARAGTRAKPVVVFIGDGTNDAPALAAATIGVHMSSSSSDCAVDSAVARSAADAVLVRPDLGGLLILSDLSKAAMRRVIFNFVWSAIYNIFAILLAGGAFVSAGDGLGARIPPAYAGLGEIVSVLPVILVAVMLRWVRFTT